MDNLYTTGIDKLGLAIWSVTWRQDWPLDNNRPRHFGRLLALQLQG